MKLGEILVDQGVISDEDLGNILEAQEVSRLVRLGERLIEKKVISPSELEKH